MRALLFPEAGKAVKFWLDRMTRRWRPLMYRQTGPELESLSDRELKDIGICRSDIPRILREGRT
ncbi:MAG: hypothetical protein VR78_08250 [Hoeflea sp. BRH_c9]|nr:MAG: hypothetical protein VR78_08250 [Hoeflea sp. BRH_c9]